MRVPTKMTKKVRAFSPMLIKFEPYKNTNEKIQITNRSMGNSWSPLILHKLLGGCRER
jgi:hypothetical protein